jgi:hypothetical protein
MMNYFAVVLADRVSFEIRVWIGEWEVGQIKCCLLQMEMRFHRILPFISLNKDAG